MQAEPTPSASQESVAHLWPAQLPRSADVAAGQNGHPRPVAVAPFFRHKRVADPILAAILLAPALPIMGLLILIVRLSSRGPGIYRQLRVGENGREYMMYKIRTMRDDAEAATGPVWTAGASDPRITPIGRVLRKLHLDEFPQLLNVLKGQMSLIGPRPERPEFVEALSEAIPGYRHRLLVRPGITGLAQINLPPDTDLDSVRRKLLLDMQYVEEANFWDDLRMFLCTLLRLTGIPGRHATAIMRLERKVRLAAPEEREQAGRGDVPPTPAEIDPPRPDDGEPLSDDATVAPRLPR